MNSLTNTLLALCAFCLMLVLTQPRLQAQDTGFGLGLIVGEPTGLSFKYWLGQGDAIDAALAWSLEGRSSVTIHGDYLRHFDVIDIEQGHLPFYAGIGGRLKFLEDRPNHEDDENVRFGLRIPLGIAYLFPDIPLELFAELVPILDLVPSTDFDLDGGVGARWYF